jgi:hypothetical protein
MSHAPIQYTRQLSIQSPIPTAWRSQKHFVCRCVSDVRGSVAP